ncbi:MAG: sulfur carrier protein ThiS [Acidobacteriota bacterium]
MIAIVLNGQPREVPAGLTAAGLLAHLGRDPRVVALERNAEIVPRARFDDVAIEAGDRLELVQFVQGG